MPKPMFDDDPLNSGLIEATVGDELRVIPMAIFQDVFDELAERYRAEGLEGEDLDIAIRDALPWALAEVLDEPCSTRH